MTKFVKDIMIVEIETTGDDTEKDAVIQLSAVVLDKDNLLEKDVFNRYIRTSLLEGTLKKHAIQLGVSFENIQKSSKTQDVAKAFLGFNTEATMAVQTMRHLLFLKGMYKKAGYAFMADQHVLQMWTLEYMFCLKLGFKKIPTMQTILEHYKIPVKNPGNALERARLEAEVLRRIIK